jgi:rod shape-determining protein MreD
MIKDLFRYSLSFIVLILIQVLFLNNLSLSVYINPYLYVLFILILPFEMPRAMVLLICLVCGLTVDAFSNSVGMHASACVLIGFVRPYLLNFIAPRDGYEFGLKPHVQFMGWSWFLIYAGIMVLLHHLFLFYVEAFSFTNFFITLFKALLSTLFTLFLVVISELLIYNR